MDIVTIGILAILTAVRVFCALILISGIRAYLRVSVTISISLVLGVWAVLTTNRRLMPSVPTTGIEFFLAAVFEAAYGLATICPVALLLEMPNLTGRIIDVARGAQFAEQSYPGTEQRASLLEHSLCFLTIVFVFSGEAYQAFVTRIVLAPLVVEKVGFPNINWTSLLSRISEGLSIGVGCALPVVIACLIIDCLSALVNKMLERVNLQQEALQIKLLVGIAVVCLMWEGGAFEQPLERFVRLLEWN